MKKLLSAIAIAAALGCSCAAASPLVTADVPLDSSYYGYLDKLEGMGYIQDMPANTKPYSRLDMAKWVLQAEAIAQSRASRCRHTCRTGWMQCARDWQRRLLTCRVQGKSIM